MHSGSRFQPPFLPSPGRFTFGKAGVGYCSLIQQRAPSHFTQLYLPAPTLMLVRRGAKIARFGATRLEAESGAAIVVPGGIFIDIDNQPDATGLYEALALNIDCTASEISQGRTVTHGVVRPQEGFLSALEAARDAVRPESGIPQDIAIHRFREVLMWLSAENIAFQHQQATPLPIRVRKLLSSDPARSWRAGEVAEALAVSEPTLRRHLARQETTLTDLLMDVRLSHALHLLQTSEAPITQIALDCGYQSPSQFARRFHLRFGLTPSALRGIPNRNERMETIFDRSGAAVAKYSPMVMPVPET